jgi:hypothetical protein
LFHQQRKRLVKMTYICVAERAGDTCPVSQVMQPVALLYQTSANKGGYRV